MRQRRAHRPRRGLAYPVLPHEAGERFAQKGWPGARGRALGAVGLSGRTEFPHLHISVQKNGKVVDPFVGVEGGAECDLGKTPLWRRDVLEKLRYISAIPYHAGFTDHLPTTEEVPKGSFSRQTTSRFPQKDDGGIDLDRVTSIIVIEVVDYH